MNGGILTLKRWPANVNPYRRLGRILGFTACLALAEPWSLEAAETPPVSRFTRAPYLQMATPTSVYVVFRTEGPIQAAVRYGLIPQRLDRSAPVQNIHLRISLGNEASEPNPHRVILSSPRYSRWPKLHSAPVGTVQYEVQVAGLNPDTRYYYAVFDGEQRLTPEDPSYSFMTHPRIGQARAVRFWVLGDSGVGHEPQRSVYRAMVDRAQRDRRMPDFAIHLGDMAYEEGQDLEFQTRFFDVYEPTLRQTVLWPTLGNHEGKTSSGRDGIGPYYDAFVVTRRGEAGGVPSGTEAYYSFDYGRIHFICLDSSDLDRTQNGAMAQWLRADLHRTKADWLLAFWHHAPYSKGTHDSDTEIELLEMRSHIMPLLESGGVDMVLTGHSHTYERSMLMDGAYATPTVAENVILDQGDGDPAGDGPYRKSAGLRPHEGTVLVVSGQGGADLGRKGTMPVMKRVLLEHGSVLMDVAGDTLTGIMINQNGFERDRFSIVKRGQVTPKRLSNPQQLPPYSTSSTALRP